MKVLDPNGEIFAESIITDLRDGRVNVIDYPSNLTTDFTYDISGNTGYIHIRGESAVRVVQDNNAGSTTLIGDHVSKSSRKQVRML